MVQGAPVQRSHFEAAFKATFKWHFINQQQVVQQELQ
jgi:hypothetical protein